MNKIAIRTPAFILAAFLAFMGLQKFVGDVPIFEIIETNLAQQTGLGLAFIEPHGRYLTGILEFAAAGLLVFRRRWGAILSLAILAGAIGAHLTVLGISTPVSGEPGAETSPMLFLMALAATAVAALTLWIETRKPAVP